MSELKIIDIDFYDNTGTSVSFQQLEIPTHLINKVVIESLLDHKDLIALIEDGNDGIKPYVERYLYLPK